MNWLRRVLTENIGLKLLSLSLAAILWAVVGGDIPTEIVLPIPVEFRNVPPGLEFVAEPSWVDVRVRGLSRRVRQAAAADFTVPVDFSRLDGPGEKSVLLRPADVEAPASLEVVQITPAQVTLTVREVSPK